MSLYLQLVRHFLGAGTMFGFAVGLCMAITTNGIVGFACGLCSGVLLACGVPAFLVIAGRKNRAVVTRGN